MVNTTIIENVTTIEGYFAFPNLITGDLFWIAMMLLLFVIAFLNFQRNNKVRTSAVVAAFITTLVSLFFSFVGLVQFNLFVQLLLALAFMAVIFYEKLQ